MAGAAAQPRRLALLAMLAVTGDRAQTRDKLIAALWPDADEERARRALTQALYALRQDLGSEDVFIGVKDLRLNPELITADLLEFRAACASGALERAADLYRGPFLDGFHLPGADVFERWAEEQRDTLAREFAGLLDELGKKASAAGDHRAAVGWFKRLAGLDPLNARVALSLMQAHVAQGDQAAALQHARVYEALLHQELDLPPDREVVAFAAQLRRGARTEPGSPAAAATTRAAPAVASVSPASPVEESAGTIVGSGHTWAGPS